MDDSNEQASETVKSDSERIPPSVRFSHEVLQFDLGATVATLEKEHHPSKLGHRQIALYKCDQVTVALFQFEKDGFLPQHKANGTVLIQLIEGDLSVTTAGEERRLTPGTLLVLTPSLPHDVHAYEKSVMLLTVCLQH